ncbi:hypothetical protein AB0O91_05820 [Kitasatospora sp. NPDC089797]|uniref:hypothetical protein n=1 Tax=Kitasatospora sp. NPDC089797 TaxID=3155298 RepID=UPI003422917C
MALLLILGGFLLGAGLHAALWLALRARAPRAARALSFLGAAVVATAGLWATSGLRDNGPLGGVVHPDSLFNTGFIFAIAIGTATVKAARQEKP